MKVLFEKNKKDKEEWLYLWKNYLNKEIYAHPEYLMLEITEGSNACCAVYKNNNEIVMYPFILRDITYLDYFKDYPFKIYDTITPYGYGGFYYNGNKEKRTIILKMFWEEYSKWAKENNVICEFIRFNLNIDYLNCYPGQILHNNNNVIVDLTKNIELIYKEFKHKVRKNINRAISYNLKILIDTNGDNIDNFIKIYYKTMNRRNASTYYFFSKEYFLRLNENLKGNFLYMYVLLDEFVLSAELILLSEINIYSFLGGSNEEFYHLRPNDFLKLKIIEWGIENKKSAFVLGGGYLPNDGIFEYKKSFSPNTIKPFYVGKQIYNKIVYQDLINITKEKNPLLNPNNQFFPLYRS